MMGRENVDERTVAGFGEEWSKFDQSESSSEELERAFNQYFSIFPWGRLPPAARGIDVGCGSGRWARLVAPRVGQLQCVDASEAALGVATRNLNQQENVSFTLASVGALPFEDATFDFGYSLGVLHHVPDTTAGIRECARVLKPGAPLLLYLYYALENRPLWYRSVWRTSDALRRFACRLPQPLKLAFADVAAAAIYWPLARTALVAERMGADVSTIPLSYYRRHTFYLMRNDALDRFGTPLEQRFTRAQVETMMRSAGLERIEFREGTPYWCAVGFKTVTS